MINNFEIPYYLCKQNHQLQWKPSTTLTECGLCGKNPPINRTMYKCDFCNVKFCVFCIQPPLFGIHCGMGHAMKLTATPYHICDYCGKTISDKAYRCVTCDFDICLNCRIEKED